MGHEEDGRVNENMLREHARSGTDHFAISGIFRGSFPGLRHRRRRWELPAGFWKLPEALRGFWLTHVCTCVHTPVPPMCSLPVMPADVRALRNAFIRLELWAAWASAHVVASWLPGASLPPPQGRVSGWPGRGKRICRQDAWASQCRRGWAAQPVGSAWPCPSLLPRGLPALSCRGRGGVRGAVCAAMSSIPAEPQWLGEEDAPPAPVSRFPRRVPPQGTLWERTTATEWVQPPHTHPGHMGPDDAEGRCVCSVCTCVWKVCAPGRSGERPSVEPVATLPPACPHPPVHLPKPSLARGHSPIPSLHGLFLS